MDNDSETQANVEGMTEAVEVSPSELHDRREAEEEQCDLK